MKAYKCISNNPGYHLTIGKIYLVEKYVQPYKVDKIKHIIINDKGFEHFIFDDELENFIDIEQLREEKLNELGI
jgi:CRISPR/Cas system CSM-associated protein Csm4 (group 5 of RAMP superfamily)